MPNDSITVTAPKAVTNLVEILKWKTVFIFHENATGTCENNNEQLKLMS